METVSSEACAEAVLTLRGVEVLILVLLFTVSSVLLLLDDGVDGNAVCIRMMELVTAADLPMEVAVPMSLLLPRMLCPECRLANAVNSEGDLLPRKADEGVVNANALLLPPRLLKA
jgi:hypothetical protein